MATPTNYYLGVATSVSTPAMSELVDDLEQLGVVERRPDPSDGRAKLICLTDAGWEAMRTARRIIAEIERDYAGLTRRFPQQAQEERLGSAVPAASRGCESTAPPGPLLLRLVLTDARGIRRTAWWMRE